jgi:putative flippase GtrA
MIFFSNNITKRFISNEVKRFIIVGSSTVLLDLICYFALVQFGFESSISKG